MSDLLSASTWWLVCAAALVVTGVAVWALRRAVSRRSAPRAGRAGAVPLHGGYLVATVVIAVVALALILVAFTMSYAALYESATWLQDTQLHAINDGDLRFLFPVGIDAVIVYFLAMDLLMEWQGRRHALNRWAAYALSAITIILNVSQGDGSTASYLGHAGPPIVIILIAEGVAAWIRHLAGLAHGQAADRIPVGRWIAHPVSTLKVARLMLGWGITSYPRALEHEQRRQLAYAMLREQHGLSWRRHTPRHLRWMLDNGYELDTAFELTRAMTAATVAMTAAEATALANPDGQVGHEAGHSGQRGHDGVHQEPAAALEEGLERPDPDPAEGRGQDAADTAPEAPVVEAGTGTEEASGQEAPAPVPESVPAPYWTREGPVVHSPMTQEELAAPASSEPLAAAESEPVVREKAVPEPLSPEQKRERVRELLRSRPEITDAEIAEHIHASPRTARRYRSELTQQSSLVDTSR
ncbi:DUF2637 domain-containing protein [Nocardiopsis sp. TNDT3]|uniref:DUF2637 domain-containing protein n=1 Tax=Nocardiopsis sp. TNDT3 TaxID=2249354 RepID=UPI000E3D9C8D|nr:DUF2637 domain-containing protein [Nocardiopsis sp. TNDT3]